MAGLSFLAKKSVVYTLSSLNMRPIMSVMISEQKTYSLHSLFAASSSIFIIHSTCKHPLDNFIHNGEKTFRLTTQLQNMYPLKVWSVTDLGFLLLNAEKHVMFFMSHVVVIIMCAVFALCLEKMYSHMKYILIMMGQSLNLLEEKDIRYHLLYGIITARC